MIKFFRHIRRTLLSKGKTGKYLKYAIGEIFLVMIGILLALQVNIWNENRKLMNSIDNLLVTFEQELVYNISQSDGLIGRGYFNDSLLTKYYNNEITPEEIRINGRVFLGFNTRSRQFNDENLNKLIHLEKDLPQDLLQLIPKLKQLKRRIESQRYFEGRIRDLAITRSKENTDQLPWYFMRDSVSIERMVKHVLTDSIYKNKIRHYNGLDLNENTWDASLIKAACVIILWDIKNLRGTQENSIETFLQSLDLIPIKELPCDGFPFREMESVSFRQSFVFYNNTRDTITYRNVNLKGDPIGSRVRSLAPKSFVFGEIAFRPNRLIEVSLNDSCKKIYHKTKEDYIVVN